MKKKILIITTSRADFDLLKPIINKLKNNRKTQTKLMVSGSHFDGKFGYTYKDIIKSGLKVDFQFKMNFRKLSKKELIKNLSGYIRKLSFYIEKNNFNIILILGDRYETLVSAFIANFHNVPIAHISGGEITEGSQDDSFRHAISKLSSIHFVSHSIYKKRLIQLGEDKKKIFNFGSLGVENIYSTNILNKKQLENKLKIKFNSKNISLTYHPETVNYHNNIKNFKILINSLLEFKNFNIFITSPNADYGSKDIILQINKLCKIHKNIYFLKHLGKQNYFSLINHSDISIGNSSSGITEVPYIKLFSINVGSRQKGRIMHKNVINVPFNKTKIVNQINKCLKMSGKSKNVKSNNSTSLKISKKLSEISLKNIFPKKFFDLSFDNKNIN
jgi:GDP/UDP-N,N'-diacetylbacillosamine 2-epimerase (hydrolysing)